MLALSWAVASASNSRVFWINWCQINHILLCKMVTVVNTRHGTVFSFCFYICLVTKKGVLYRNCQIIITGCYWYKAHHRAWLMCGSAIFTRLRTVCCLCGSFICASRGTVFAIQFSHFCA